MAQYGSGVQSFANTLGDLNNDSHPDGIVVNYASNSMSLFRGYGNGTFAAEVTVTTGSQPALGSHCRREP